MRCDADEQMPFEIRDPVHDLVPRTYLECRVMNTSAMQRLRRIKQLALACFVYHGANHCRFGHSVGVMHLAGRIAKRFQEQDLLNSEQVEDIRLAALLHDVGHGPFSHVAEDLLDRYYDRDKVDAGSNKESIHERVTVDMIRNDEELQGVLGEDRAQRVVDILSHKEPGWFGQDIVSGPLDADKLDYILRDCRAAGVRYGEYDVSKIIDSLTIITFPGTGGNTGIGLDHEGVYAVEQMVLAKHHMNAQVYRHRIRAISDAMLVRGQELAISEGVDWVARLYRYDGSKEFIDNYLTYHDDRVLWQLAQDGGERSKAMFQRLLNRRLLKRVYSKRLLSEINDALKRSWLAAMTPNEIAACEKSIADRLNVDPAFAILNRVTIKNPTYRPPGFKFNSDEILVSLPDGIRRSLKDLEWSIFKLRPEQDTEQMIQVYAPADHITDMDKPEKKKEYERLEREVESVLLGGT